jgi:hypothetical protein
MKRARPAVKLECTKKAGLNVKPVFKPFTKFSGTPVKISWLAVLNAVAEMLVRETMEMDKATRKRARALLAKDNIFAAKEFSTRKGTGYLLRYSFRDGKLYLAKVISEGKNGNRSRNIGKQHFAGLKTVINAAGGKR